LKHLINNVCFISKNMLFEVEFVTKEKGYFETIHTALVHALSVSECRQIASEIANQLGKGGIQFFISEFTD
jgi:hypothetical protein